MSEDADATAEENQEAEVEEDQANIAVCVTDNRGK